MASKRSEASRKGWITRRENIDKQTMKSIGKKFHGVKLNEKTLTSSPRRGGLSSSNLDRIPPRIEFWKRMEYYLTIGRIQNVVESYVLDIINREHYYDAGQDQDDAFIEKHVKIMEQWQETIDFARFKGTLIRNWVINGVNIVSPDDWEFLQLQSVIAKTRDDFGVTEFYLQVHNGVEHKLDANRFIEEPYIDMDREPWGVGMFDSIMNRDFLDVDGRDGLSTAELYRQALQDNMKIHHKFASPRVIYTAPEANEATIDEDIVPTIEGMHPGDRAVFNENIEIQQETVDGNARFIEHVNKIIDEIDTGLQSSANRVIAEPSAMADAREAGAQDDDRTLGLMERLRIFMNRHVIPRITGLEPGMLVFKWGGKDAFDIEFPEPLKNALDSGILSKQQAQLMLEEQYHWKIPTDEDIIEKFGAIEEDEPEEEEPEKPPQGGDSQPTKKKEESLQQTSSKEKFYNTLNDLALDMRGKSA